MKKLLILFFTSALILQNVFSQPFSIGERTITFVDPSRQTGIFFPTNRQIETRIYYPAQAAGNNQTAIQADFPLIVIGHGFGMNSQHYENYWLELVPRGYIVALPRTESSVIPFPSHPDFGLDLAFVENAMFVENSNSNSPFYQTLRQASAIMGHSMGGGCTFLAAENNPSPRLKTIVGLAAAETKTSAINAAQNVTIDALVFGGSGDGVTPPADNQIPMYNNLASQCKFYVEIIGGGHCNFASSSNTCELGEIFTGGNQLSRAQQHPIIYSFLNPWLDFKLKESCEAWDLFQENLNTSTDITFQESCNYVVTPDVEIDPNGSNDLCFGETIDLEGSINLNYTYQWFNENGIINGANTIEYTALETGSYFLEATTLHFGCKDSSSLALVNIASNDTTVINLDVCIGFSITLDNGYAINSDTIVYETYDNINNCDSVVRYTVSEVSEFVQIENFNICFGDSLLLPDNTYAFSTNVYDFNYTSQTTGCDSVYQVNITISEALEDLTIHVNICEGDSFQLPDGSFVNNEGFYDGDTLQNVFGCDSVFRNFDLFVTSPIGFDESNIRYEYLSSVDFFGDSILFYVLNSSIYDSIIWESSDGWADLSYVINDTAYYTTTIADALFVSGIAYNGVCANPFSLSITSIKDIKENKLSVYPNPTNNILTIELPQNQELEQETTIFNLLGKVVYNGSISKQNYQIDVSNLATGLYTIIIGNSHAKFIKND